MTEALNRLLAEIRACHRCESDLPLGPRPMVQAAAGAKLLIVGQAPGTKVHTTGIPFNDPSGDRLRDWLGIGPDVFYDPHKVAILPAGLCYPGRGKSGDLPPLPVCAPLWHPRLRALLPDLQLTLLVGAYAQAYYLGERRGRTLSDTVRNFRAYGPLFLPLPHPSPRNRLWLRQRPWFDEEVLPEVRRRVAALVFRPGAG